MAETSDNNGAGDPHDIGPPEVRHRKDTKPDQFIILLAIQVGLSSVDKQALVEDWLNPGEGEAGAPGDNAETKEVISAPQVQHRPGLPETEHNYPKPGTSAQQKISKVGS